MDYMIATGLFVALGVGCYVIYNASCKSSAERKMCFHCASDAKTQMAVQEDLYIMGAAQTQEPSGEIIEDEPKGIKEEFLDTAKSVSLSTLKEEGRLTKKYKTGTKKKAATKKKSMAKGEKKPKNEKKSKALPVTSDK